MVHECGMSTPTRPKGYHETPIIKGTVGEVTKIFEEAMELQDAHFQGVKIMELVELSDLYGAIEMFLEKYHKDLSMQDLKKMSDKTRQAFQSGARK